MKVIAFCKKYKYILTLLIFAAYLFFGENNVLENVKLDSEIERLKHELQKYHGQIANTKKQNAISSYSTKDEQEEYFRKQHHYKKENEDIFRLSYSNED
jgi:cell division protein FtsB